MTPHKLLLLLLLPILLLFLALVGVASAVLETNPVQLGDAGSDVSTIWNGMRVTANEDMLVTQVCIEPSPLGFTTKPTRIAIYNTTGVMQNASITNNCSTFNATLTLGSTYYFVAGHSGASYRRTQNTTVTYPVAESYFTWTAGADGSGIPFTNNTGAAFNIKNITFTIQIENIIVKTTDIVTGGFINGLCVEFTQGTTAGENTTCVPETAQTYPLSPESLCGVGDTCEDIIDEMNYQTSLQIIDEDISSLGTMSGMRWYTTEGTCTGTLCQDQLHPGGTSCTTRSVSNHQFCQVTDQIGIALINFATGSNQTRYELLHNMSEALRHPTANNLQCWKSYVNGEQAYTDYTQLCVTDDSASDASLAILQAYSISCAKQRGGVWTNTSVDYCADYVEQGRAIWGLGTSLHGEIKYLSNGDAFLCNGFDNQVGCPTSAESFRPDYYLLQPLMDFAEYTGNTSMQAHVIDMLTHYNLSKGTNNIHNDKTGHFNSLGTVYTPDGVLSPPYMDNIDTWRAFMWLGQFYNTHADRINGTLNTSIFAYWWTWYSGGNASYTPTNVKPFEIYSNAANGVIKTTENSYKTSAMHAPLAARFNNTYAQALIGDLVDTKWLGNRFSGAAYMAGYYSQYAVAAIGHVSGMSDPNTWSSGVCTPDSPPEYVIGGVSIVLNNPFNESIFSASTVTLNVTLRNNNATGSQTSGALPHVIYATNFTTNPTTDGWNLGSGWAYNSVAKKLVFNGTNFQGNAYTPGMNLTTECLLGCNFTLNMSTSNTSLFKFHYMTTSGTLSNAKYHLERVNETHHQFKFDGGTFSTTDTFPNGVEQQFRIFLNVTGNVTKACRVGGTCTSLEAAEIGIVGNYFGFQGATTNANSVLNISRFEVMNAYTPYNTSGSTNSLMNVSFLNSALTVLNTTTNASNNTAVTHTISGLSDGSVTWYVRVVSQNNNVTFGPLVFTRNSGVGTSTELCNLTGESVALVNATGTYNISVYSLGFGNASFEGLYFNVSRLNYELTTSSTLLFESTQGWLNVTPRLVLLDTLINGFNISNGVFTNTTNATSTVIPASFGLNTVQVKVAGNFTQNFSMTLNTLLATEHENASGIHDNEFTIGANFGGTGISTFILNVSNASLTNSSLKNTTNGSITYHLLRGYSYFFELDAEDFASNNVTLDANASTNFYNFTLLTTNTINISYYDETTGVLLNTTNISLTMFSEHETRTLSTTSGHLSMTLLMPGNFTLVSTATGYLPRFYQFMLVNNTFTFLNLSLLNATIGELVTINVKDTLDVPVENAVVKILKQNTATGEYDVHEIRNTNFEGQTQAGMILDGPLYQFIIEYNGRIVFSSTSTQIYSTSLTFIIDTSVSGGFEEVFVGFSLSGDVTFDNETNRFSYVFNDQSNTATQACLVAYHLSETRTIYNTTCTDTSTGSLTVTILNQSGRVYEARGTLYVSPTNYTLDTLYASYGDLIPEDGSGLLMLFVMILVFTFAMKANVEIAIAVSSAVPLMFTLANLTRLDYTITIALFAGGLFLAFLLGLVRRG